MPESTFNLSIKLEVEEKEQKFQVIITTEREEKVHEFDTEQSAREFFMSWIGSHLLFPFEDIEPTHPQKPQA